MFSVRGRRRGQRTRQESMRTRSLDEDVEREREHGTFPDPQMSSADSGILNLMPAVVAHLVQRV